MASGVGGPEWASLFYNQRRLESFESHLHVCPLSFYHYIFKKNWQSLREVTLINLSCWESPEHFYPIDLSAFQNCIFLQKLILARYLYEESPVAICPTVPDLFGVQNLSNTVKELSFSAFRVPHNEFFSIAHGLPELESLTLINCGSTGSFGLSGTGLEELLTNLNQLKTLRLKSLNAELPSEGVKLREVIRRLTRGDFNSDSDSSDDSTSIIPDPAKHSINLTFPKPGMNPFSRTFKY